MYLCLNCTYNTYEYLTFFHVFILFQSKVINKTAQNYNSDKHYFHAISYCVHWQNAGSICTNHSMRLCWHTFMYRCDCMGRVWTSMKMNENFTIQKYRPPRIGFRYVAPFGPVILRRSRIINDRRVIAALETQSTATRACRRMPYSQHAI